MLDNEINLAVEHVSTVANNVADDTLVLSRKQNWLTFFLFSNRSTRSYVDVDDSTLVSTIMEVLLQGECKNPLALNELLRSDPGRITS
jgi:hypothetical protein